MRIFISYAHVDWQFVDKLANRLRRYHEVWFDERLHAGQEWWQAILEQLDWCECFIYALSPESLASKYCRNEYDEARNLDKHIIPIRLQPNIELPDMLQRIQYADFSTRRFEDALVDLTGDLGRLELQTRVQETHASAKKKPPLTAPIVQETLDEVVTFRDAVDARKTEDHETALRLLYTLAREAPDFLPEEVTGLIKHSQGELERQARQKEYDRQYQQVSLLALDPLTLESAWQLWEGLQKDFPEIDDDPEELAIAFQRRAQPDTHAQFEEFRRQEELAAPVPVPTTQPATRGPYPLWIGAGVIGAGLLVGILALAGVFGRGAVPEESASEAEVPVVEIAEEGATEAPEEEATPTVMLTPTPFESALTGGDCLSASLPESACTGVERNDNWTPVTLEFNGVEMALVPAGCFMMGSEEGEDDEKPIHEQCFDKPFWIDVYEVTNGQYESPGEFSGDNRPRETVSWFEAVAHCEWRGARLPTEAEWEYATRGPDSWTYPWENGFKSDYVIFSTSETADVGSKPNGASWVGALDMSGNVWEWVSSIYADYSYSAIEGREADGDSDSSSERVLRGGSWLDYDASNLRAASRSGFDPNFTSYSSGFRCARSF